VKILDDTLKIIRVDLPPLRSCRQRDGHTLNRHLRRAKINIYDRDRCTICREPMGDPDPHGSPTNYRDSHFISVAP